MGNSQSNRKITIEKDEVTGVIKLSDSVVRRLKGEIEKAASNHVEKEHRISQKVENNEPAEQPTAVEPPATTPPSEQPYVAVTQSTAEDSQGESVPNVTSVPVTVVLQQQPQQQPSEPRPYEEFMEEAHLTALKIRKDKESEIRKIEEYWRTQLSNLTHEYENLGQLTETQFHATVADVESCFAKESFFNVCSVPKEEVLQCYLANKEQPLNCSEHVKRFKACAEQFRLANLAPKSSR